ncbi:hypothetical protein BGS_0578 [Beggiatoa sp. SS]|nr:hypothetical protein BGS_0578 [Beggiatoa sp. SS]
MPNSLYVETRCFAFQLRVSASRLSFAFQLRVSASRLGFKETQGIASKRGIAFWFRGDARHRVSTENNPYPKLSTFDKLIGGKGSTVIIVLIPDYAFTFASKRD